MIYQNQVGVRLDFFTKLRSDIEFEDDKAENENTTENMELFVESDNGKKSRSCKTLSIIC